MNKICQKLTKFYRSCQKLLHKLKIMRNSLFLPSKYSFLILGCGKRKRKTNEVRDITCCHFSKNIVNITAKFDSLVYTHYTFNDSEWFFFSVVIKDMKKFNHLLNGELSTQLNEQNCLKVLCTLQLWYSKFKISEG